MSEAQKLIIQILEGIFATWIDRDGVRHVLVDGDYDGITGRPIADVAVEIDKALGGLTREEMEGMRAGDDPRLDPYRETRWVAGWTEVTE